MPSEKSLNLITLLPSEKVSQQVLEFKEEIKSKYALTHALKLPAHLTLQRPFWMHKDNELLLNDHLERFVKGQCTFDTTLEGFDHFSQRALYIEVTNPDPIIELQVNLQNELPDGLFLKEKERQFKSIKPHITLASRDLKSTVFAKVFDEFRNRDYKASFKANKIAWFRHNGKTWDLKSSLQIHTED